MVIKNLIYMLWYGEKVLRKLLCFNVYWDGWFYVFFDLYLLFWFRFLNRYIGGKDDLIRFYISFVVELSIVIFN